MATYLDNAQLSGRTYNRTKENRTRIEESGCAEVDWIDDDSDKGFQPVFFENPAQIN